MPSPTNDKKVGVCDHACVDSNITLHNNNDTDHGINILNYFTIVVAIHSS